MPSALSSERDRHRRPHPRRRRVLVGALEDAPVRLLDQRRDPLLAAVVAGRLLEDGCGEAGRDLAGLGAAHSVGDREERRLGDVCVLVAPAAAAGIGDAGVARQHQTSNLKSVWPTRTTSPLARRRGVVTRGAVDEGAVRRADVLDPDAVAPRLEARVPRGRELVAVERDLVLAAAADRHRQRVDRHLLARVQRGALEHDAAWRALPALRPRARGLAGAEDHALLRGRRRSRLALRTIRQMKR